MPVTLAQLNTVSMLNMNTVSTLNTVSIDSGPTDTMTSLMSSSDTAHWLKARNRLKQDLASAASVRAIVNVLEVSPYQFLPRRLTRTPDGSTGTAGLPVHSAHSGQVLATVIFTLQGRPYISFRDGHT
jgi:hypothetical protein